MQLLLHQPNVYTNQTDKDFKVRLKTIIVTDKEIGSFLCSQQVGF